MADFQPGPDGKAQPPRASINTPAKRRQRLPEHRAVMVAGTSQAQLAAIEADVGLGFLSRLALANRSLPRVVAVGIEGMKLKRTLYLPYQGASLSPVAQALVDLVAGMIN